MRFPLHVATDMIQHQARNAIKGNKRYPFVLMLEPLYTCNLACLGCATERHTGKLKDRLSVEQCLHRDRSPGSGGNGDGAIHRTKLVGPVGFERRCREHDRGAHVSHERTVYRGR